MTFYHDWLKCTFVQSYCRILGSSISLEGNNVLDFLHTRASYQRKNVTYECCIWLGVAMCVQPCADFISGWLWLAWMSLYVHIKNSGTLWHDRFTGRLEKNILFWSERFETNLKNLKQAEYFRLNVASNPVYC